MLRLILFAHVLGAIVAVGPALTYGAWLGLGRKAGPREHAFTFRGVLWLDSRLVTPAFGWQLVSGLLLVFVYHLAEIGEPWLVASLVIYGLTMLTATFVVAPRARRALAALERDGPDAPVYLSYRRLMRGLTPMMAIGTLTIVFLMVVRPG